MTSHVQLLRYSLANQLDNKYCALFYNQEWRQDMIRNWAIVARLQIRAVNEAANLQENQGEMFHH